MDDSGFDLLLTDPRHPFHLKHMERALSLAEQAYAEDEVPVGCVIVSLEREAIVAEAYNQRERLKDPTAHAEMIAITQAAASLRSWRLEHCLLYVTLEPCPMCAGAIVQARVPIVIYGAADAKAGACRSLFQLADDSRLNHRAKIIPGVLAERCGAVLSSFFAAKRALGKK